MPDRPNILFVHTDEQRVDSINCYGNNIVRTPAIDELAEDGVTFEEGHCTHPLCSPSRASLLTGRYPSTNGVWRNGIPLDKTETTIADRLNDSGYRTGLFGKAHFTPYMADPDIYPESVHTRSVDDDDCWEYWEDFSGPYYGFEEVEMTLFHGPLERTGGHYGLWLEQNHADSKHLFEQSEALDDTDPDLNSWKSAVPLELHSSTWVADRTVDFIKNTKENPFFAWVGFPDPHFPYNPPKPYCNRYDPEDVSLPVDPEGDIWEDQHIPRYIEYHLNEKYGIDFRELNEKKQREIIAHTYAMVDLVDDSIGRILDALKTTGQAKNTVVVFTSDHGDWLGDHGLFQKGLPHTRNLTRIPWIVRWPDVTVPGRRVAAPTSQVDIVPTLLDAAGVEVPYGIQGESLRPVLRGDDEALRPFAYVEHRHEGYRRESNLVRNPRDNIAGGAMQDIVNWGTEDIHVKTIYAEDHRLSYIKGVPEDYGELFDLTADPDEMNNLWDSKGDKKQELMNHLADALIHAQDPLPEREYGV